MPLKPSHNLLVRGSNPCGGTNQPASCLTLTSSCCWVDTCSTARWREDGAKMARFGRCEWHGRPARDCLARARFARHEVSIVRGRDGFDDPDTLLCLILTTFPGLVC